MIRVSVLQVFFMLDILLSVKEYELIQFSQ